MSAALSRPAVPGFHAPYAPDDAVLAGQFLQGATLAPAREARIDVEARRLVTAIRASASGIGGIEALLREYSLSTPEGLALMVLAEGLLRVPDDATADRLIEDKLGQGGFAQGPDTRPDSLLVSASAWALGLSARLIGPADTPEGILRGVVRRLGLPTVRGALRQAMRVMGNHFVLGQTIEEALGRAGSRAGRVFRYSFDMLGEGARTADDASHYQTSYADAIEAIGRAAGNKPLPDRPGISVKLSALHPRYEAVSRARVMDELVPRVRELARRGGDTRAELHRGCGGSRPAGIVAGRDRRGGGGPAVVRLGRVRAGGAGVRQAGARDDRLGGRAGGDAGPAVHGASGEGCLLGHRDQARAGARPGGLSGVHAQADDGSELYGVCGAPAGAAAAHLSAIRHA